MLLEDVCWAIEEEDRREAVWEVCDYKGGKASKSDPLAEKGCAKAKALLCGECGVLE